MKKRTSKRLVTDDEVVKLAIQVRAKLAQLDIDVTQNSALDRLPVDLADVYEVCANYQRIIDNLLLMPESSSKTHAKKLFDDIYQHLFIHLPYHLKTLPTGLRKLSQAFEAQGVHTDPLQEILTKISRK